MKKILALLVCVLTLSGCSSTSQDLQVTVCSFTEKQETANFIVKNIYYHQNDLVSRIESIEIAEGDDTDSLDEINLSMSMKYESLSAIDGFEVMSAYENNKVIWNVVRDFEVLDIATLQAFDPSFFMFLNYDNEVSLNKTISFMLSSGIECELMENYDSSNDNIEFYLN